MSSQPRPVSKPQQEKNRAWWEWNSIKSKLFDALAKAAQDQDQAQIMAIIQRIAEHDTKEPDKF